MGEEWNKNREDNSTMGNGTGQCSCGGRKAGGIAGEVCQPGMALESQSHPRQSMRQVAGGQWQQRRRMPR